MFSGFTGYKYYQDDKEISTKELESLFDKNSEVKAHWKKAKVKSTLAGTAFIAELGFAIWTGIELGRDNGDSIRSKGALAPALATIGTATIAAILFNSANKSKKNAILTYNKQFDNKTAFRLSPISNQNGLGLAIQF